MHEQHEHSDEWAEGKTNRKLRATTEPKVRARVSVLIEIRKTIVDGHWAVVSGVHAEGTPVAF